MTLDEVIPGGLYLLRLRAPQTLERLLLRSQGDTPHGPWVGTPELPNSSSIQRALDLGPAFGDSPIQPSIRNAPSLSEQTLPSEVGFACGTADNRPNSADWLVRKRLDFDHVTGTLTGSESLINDQLVIAVISAG